MRLFYADKRKGNQFFLEGDDYRHGVKVLRLKVGDEVNVINGKGSLFHCIVKDMNKRSLIAELVDEEIFSKPNYNLKIAISPTKNLSRFEWFVEKAVEIGISEIIPVICKRTEKPSIKKDRTKRIIHTAMKQSMNIYEPFLHPVTAFQEVINDSEAKHKYIATVEEEARLLSQREISGSEVLILIGPEGGFTSEELALARKASFCPVSLGKSRLRTETAGVVACQTIKIMSELESNDTIEPSGK